MARSMLLKALEVARPATCTPLRGAARSSAAAIAAYEVTGMRHEWLGFVWQDAAGWHAGSAITKGTAHYPSRRAAVRALR